MSSIILSKLILTTFSSSSSSESSSPPLEPQRTVTSLPSASITKPITIATSASASSSVTTLEESSPRHFQHPSPRSQQQALVSQVTKVCGKRILNYVITSLWLFKVIIIFFPCSKSHQSQFHYLHSLTQEIVSFQANRLFQMINRNLPPVCNPLPFHPLPSVGPI